MLVIIDMQEDYRDELQRQHQRFKKLLRKLEEKAFEIRRKNEPVFNLVSTFEGLTIYEILSIFNGYKRFHLCMKNKWDGSRELVREFKRLRVKKCQIEVCGLYRDKCVKSTRDGLIEAGYDVAEIDNDLVIPSPRYKLITLKEIEKRTNA